MQVLQDTPLLILFFLLQTLQVVVFILLLISVIIFVDIVFRPSTLNQNLMSLCIIDFMESEYVFCAHPTVPNLFLISL